MKKLALLLMLMLPAVGFAQSITVGGAGTAYYGTVDLNGTYSFDGTVNGKNSFKKTLSFSANGCNSCFGTQKIQWDGSQWVLSATGGGSCYYCNFTSSTIKVNTTATTLNPPCSGWSDGMSLGGDCEGGAIGSYALSVSQACQSGSVTLSWINNVTLGSGNVFTATLLRNADYNVESTLLSTLASATATEMTVNIPADAVSSSQYSIRLTASEAPTAPVSLTSTNITIGLPNDRPSVYQGTIVACEGQAVSMSTSTAFDSYQWYKVASNVYTSISGATSQSYSIPSVLEADQGDYSVQGKSAGGCLTPYSYFVPVGVSDMPEIDDLYSNVNNVCEGNTASSLVVTMENSVPGAFTYTWKKGSDIVKTETTASSNSMFSPSGGWQVGDAGQYTVVVSKAGCSSSVTSQTATARVDAPITTPPSLAPTGTLVAPVTLTPSGSIPSYQLLRWDGTTYVAVNYSSGSFSVSQAGKYVVASYNNCGISGYSNEVTVTTICDTPPTITASSFESVPATLTPSAGFDDYVWYKWDGSAYQSQSSGSSYSASTAGRYAVKGYSYNCGYSDFSTPVIVPCTDLASFKSGNWSDISVWSCGKMPVAGDNPVIGATHSVNLPGGSYSVVQLTNNGILTGTGTLSGILYNNGTVAPGNSPGTLSVTDLTNTASSVINAEISTLSSYDKIVVSGVATLAGTLNLVFIDGFVPQEGDAFDVITYGSHTGTLTTFNLPGLPTGLAWKKDYNALQLRLSVVDVNSLPVTLVSFDVRIIGSRQVKLTWATAEEMNASHFAVERSADAKHFRRITEVIASGTTRSRNEYSATDETPLSGISYYRLRQVDLDGQEYVYRAMSVQMEAEFSQIVFPNPTSQEFILMTFKGALPKVELHDVNGKKVKIRWVQTDSSSLSIKPNVRLIPGLYILTAEHEAIKLTHKVVVAE